MDDNDNTNQSGELVITRTFNAPRERVWEAWTNPEQVKHWWGPEGFTAPSAAIDLKVGGKYLLCMRSPEGQDFWNTGTYREIVPMERIVCTDSFADAQGNVVPATHYGMSADFSLEMDLTATFEDVEGGKTRLTVRYNGVPGGEDRANAIAGWNQSLDKLAATVEQDNQQG